MRHSVLVGLLAGLLYTVGCLSPQAVTVLPPDQQQALEQAIAHYQAGTYERAREALDRLREAEPNSPDILYWSGLIVGYGLYDGGEDLLWVS